MCVCEPECGVRVCLCEEIYTHVIIRGRPRSVADLQGSAAPAAEGTRKPGDWHKVYDICRNNGERRSWTIRVPPRCGPRRARSNLTCWGPGTATGAGWPARRLLIS